MKQPLVDPDKAQGKEYKNVLAIIRRKKLCPFCLENFHFSKHKILRDLGGWYLVKNSYSYQDSQFAFLIIAKRHLDKIEELTPGDWVNVQNLFTLAVKRFHIRGGALIIRFGLTRLSGATIKHLHFHLISPRVNHKTRRADPLINFPIL